MLLTYPDYIGIDIYDEPEPINIVIPINIVNNSNRRLYVKIYASSLPSDDWTDNPITDTEGIGSNSGKLYRYILTRKKSTISSVPLTEPVTVRVEMYNDSGLTNLYGTYEFTVNFDFIDRSKMTVLYEETFATGDEGWLGVYLLRDVGIAGTPCIVKYYNAYARKVYDLTGCTSAWLELHVAAKSTGSEFGADLAFIDNSTNKIVKSYLIRIAYPSFRRYVFRVPKELVGTANCKVQICMTSRDVRIDNVRIIAT